MAWDYCCCAIPILNVGAYFTLSEQFVLGILVGTLAFATPALVGASVPSFAPLIICGLGYTFAAIQLVGFLGIFKEKATLFRQYTFLNWVVLYVGLAATAAFIGISATKHTPAVIACEEAFFANTEGGGQEDTKGEQICNIFTWVSIGVMGALWVLVAIVQSYLVLVLRNYGVTQRKDHSKYQSIYSTHGDDSIALNARSGTGITETDAWDTRPSTDSWHPAGARGTTGRPYRDEDEDVIGDAAYEKKQAPNVGYGVGTSTPNRQGSVDQAYLEHPSYTKAASPSPTKYAPSISAPSYHTHVPDHTMGYPDNTRQNSGGYNPSALYDPPTYAPIR